MVPLKTIHQTKSGLTFTGKIGMSLFSLVFLGMGLFFLSFMVVQTYRNIQTRSWQTAECVITDSRVETVNDGYSFRVAYTYRWQDRTFTSNRYTLNGDATKNKINDADALKRKYRIGSHHICYVNPENPQDAILEHGSLVIILFAVLPMIFVAVGGGLFYKTWAPAGKAKTTTIKAKTAAFKTTGRWVAGIFFSIFFFVGLGIGIFWAFPAVSQYMAAGRWVETPCVILSSRVQSHSDSDGTTYSVDISYAYTVGGERYRSSRYGFIGGSSSGYQGKAEIVRRYPPGSAAVCFVNPDDPSDAVLNTELGLEVLFFLFPIIFMAVGLGGIVFSIRKRDKAAMGVVDEPMLQPSGDQISHGRRIGEMELKPGNSRFGKIVVSIAVALFWNGIVSIFVYQAYKGWQSGHPDYFLTIFLIPFVAIGLVLVGAIFYYTLAALNPVPVVTLLAESLHLGDTIKLRWRITGNVYRLQQFTLKLVGEEVATYRRGTNTYTDHNAFFSKTLMDEMDPARMRQGELPLTIPQESMHSFKSDHNAIEWKLALRGDIPRWPDIKEAFEIQVLPVLQKKERKI